MTARELSALLEETLRQLLAALRDGGYRPTPAVLEKLRGIIYGAMMPAKPSKKDHDASHVWDDDTKPGIYKPPRR